MGVGPVCTFVVPPFQLLVRFCTRAQLCSAHSNRADSSQPFTWKAAALFVVTGVGLYFYFESEKAKVQERKRE